MTEKPLDPKEQMKAALAAKKAGAHRQGAGPDAVKSSGGPQSKAAGKRQFRRKAGG